ncbi:hypothetical protein KSS87_007024 [Heliosperma pusillum]|nr:hypothetical protein KSS87_007024 [Heliosperma pusillum]
MDSTISSILSDLESQHNLSPFSHSTLSHLQSLLTHLPQSLSSEDDNPFWTEFSSRGLSISSLVTPLSAAMDSSPSSLSILATNVYLLLFISSKAPVFSLFTPMSFMSFLHCIRRNLKKNSKEGSSPNSSGNRRKKGGRAAAAAAKGKRVRVSDLDDEGDGVELEIEFDVKMLFIVLERLKLVLGLVHLGRFPDSFKSLVHTMVEIVVLGVDLCGNNVGFCKKLFDICRGILSQVLSPEHGDQEMSAAEVLKSLSPLILSTKSQARTFGLLFVKNEMMGLGQDSEFVKKAMGNLPRYLVQKAPDKSDGRALAVESIMEILKVMEFDDQLGFVNYVVKMAQGKSHLRYLAVDFIPKLITSLGEDSSNLEIESEERDSWKSRCLEALVDRCSDSIAGIRARALSSLVQLVANVPHDGRDCIVLKKALGLETGHEGGANQLLRKRCTDEKAAVRKAALLLATKLMTLVGTSLDPAILKMMGMACSDPLLSIRKAAISALSEALRIFADKSVVTEWLHSVPRLITDSETSIQEECENLFMELVLDRVSRVGCDVNNVTANQKSKSTARNFKTQLATIYGEGVLDLLGELCNAEVAPWVRKICTSLGKKKRLKPKIATSLQNIIKTSESLWLSHSMPIENWTAPAGAWLLLSIVSSFLPKAVEWIFLHHHWKLLDKDGSNLNELKSSTPDSIMRVAVEGMESNSVSWAGDRVLLLETISNVSVELASEPAAELAHDLLKRVEGFNMHSTEVNAHVKALKTLCRRKAMTPQEADALVTAVVNQLLRKASHVIDSYLSAEQEGNNENTFLTPPTNRKKSKVTPSRLMCQATSAVYTIGSLLIVCPSMEIKGVVPVLHTMITSGAEEPRSNKLPGSHIFLKQKAPSLYFQAWLTMGKICLADGKLAKRYIPLFVQKLPSIPEITTPTFKITPKTPNLVCGRVISVLFGTREGISWGSDFVGLGVVVLGVDWDFDWWERVDEGGRMGVRRITGRGRSLDGLVAPVRTMFVIVGGGRWWFRVEELEKSDCAALRNNIIVMMADFCVRYTALVD